MHSCGWLPTVLARACHQLTANSPSGWLPLYLQDSSVASGSRRRGRQAKASKQAQQAEGGAEREAAEAAAALPESRWGEEPAKLSSVGLTEDEAHFGTRLR